MKVLIQIHIVEVKPDLPNVPYMTKPSIYNFISRVAQSITSKYQMHIIQDKRLLIILFGILFRKTQTIFTSKYLKLNSTQYTVFTQLIEPIHVCDGARDERAPSLL